MPLTGNGSPHSLLWGSLLEKNWPRYALAASPELVRRRPPWPRLQTLSVMPAMGPPCISHVSAFCPLWPPFQNFVHFGRATKHLVRHVCHVVCFGPACVLHVPALCASCAGLEFLPFSGSEHKPFYGRRSEEEQVAHSLLLCQLCQTRGFIQRHLAQQMLFFKQNLLRMSQNKKGGGKRKAWETVVSEKTFEKSPSRQLQKEGVGREEGGAQAPDMQLQAREEVFVGFMCRMQGLLETNGFFLSMVVARLNVS